jgi:N-acetylneuraminic acid mutarotase
MFKLNLKTFEWKNCKPINTKSPSPRDKYSGWYSEKDERIYYFGGFGEPINDSYLNDCGEFNLDEQSNFSEDVSDSQIYYLIDLKNSLIKQPELGWNNQLVYFDLNTQTWHNPCYNKVSKKLY